MKKTFVSILALLLALTVLFASCGGSNPPAETTAEPGVTTAEPDVTTADPSTTAGETTEPESPEEETTAEVTTEPETTAPETTEGGVAIITRPEGSETVTDPGEKSPVLISLGDSIANGYGLTKQSESYTGILTKEFEYPCVLLSARDGQKSGELLSLVKMMEFDGEKTEVITISTGANNILGPAMDVFMQLFLQPNLALETLQSEEFDQQLRDGVEDLREDLPLIIDKLRESAPDAEIVILSIYNPFDGAKISLMGTDILLGEMTEEYVLLLNEVISEVAAEKGCLIADAYTAFKASTEQVVNVTADANGYIMEYDPHPNAAGHRIIASLILAALAEEDNA